MEERVKVMSVLAGGTLREIVNKANSEGIKKEDVISLLQDRGQFWLIYYR